MNDDPLILTFCITGIKQGFLSDHWDFDQEHVTFPSGLDLQVVGAGNSYGIAALELLSRY